MEMYRITQKSIAKPGALDFNIRSTWQSMWELTLDNGEKVLMDGPGLSSGRRADGAVKFVPLVGDWIYFDGSEPRVFQFMRVLEVSGDTVHLSNGELCSVNGMLRTGSATPVKNDYVVRRTDGLCAVRKQWFEEQNGDLIAAMIVAVTKEVLREQKQRKVAS